MDENADLRLTIETARKNKNWARRCYAYELAMEYFSLLEPDCYELCSYCDSIPEFLEEKNECCLIRALGAVKVFISRCVDAPSIARTVTKAIIDKLFFSASTKIREIATDIILDFIEWEACNGVLKELMTGALKYDGVRSDECIRVMRYALLDFGPHVVSVYKLIDFIAVLVRNKSFLSINDECSQLLIVIYKCLGAQVRVHLTHILDPNYITAIEDSYEEMRNIPIYHCRFVRYSKDNSSSLRESDEEMFAACRIAEPTSHPSPVSTNYENEEVVTEGDGLVLEADQAYVRDFGRESYYRGGDAGPLANENKGDWNPQRFDNVANYEVDYGIEGANQNQDDQIRLNAYDNAVAYDELDNSNRADSVPELLGDIPDVSLEPDHQRYQWNPNNFEQDHIQPVSAEDNCCQTDGYSLQSANHFEVIIQKLMNKHGTKNVLDWLWVKFNSDLKTPLNGNGIKESTEINLSRNCQSLEDLATGFLSNPEEQHNAGRSGGHQFSSTSNIAKENMEEETICLSESDSISEITPNLCCYCFQKNSIRRLASKKRDANRQDNHRTSENIKDKSGVGNITRFAGSSVDSSVHEIRKENSPFRLKNNGNLFGAMSLRHRGSGDEPSQPALNTQQVPEETTRGEVDQEGRRVQKLFCCISINDTNEEAFQFES
ncbi:unnamed protein product [Nezara viridula]|uniref:TOG domain-containing protein n=1 Tax=Nezara viridula TaxID=85310 RepID=A0A9P0HJN7_NEZVI|nr:unnamed protein product [Nezara viridula]